MPENSASLAELLIVACAEAWRGAGEIMATGIGPLPRLAAGLAKMSFSPALQTTDGEAFYTSTPVPPGKRHAAPEFEGPANYDRVFSTPLERQAPCHGGAGAARSVWAGQYQRHRRP